MVTPYAISLSKDGLRFFTGSCARLVAAGDPDALSDSSRLTDLQIVRRFLTAITNNVIFDHLTFIERMKAGPFHGGPDGDAAQRPFQPGSARSSSDLGRSAGLSLLVL